MLQGFLRVFGVIFLILGIAGFFLPTSGPLHDLLHLSAPHNLIHLISGIIFLAVSGNFKLGKVITIVFGVVYGLVAVLGLFQNDIFGLVSVTPTIEVIHFVVAALALYIGITAAEPAAKSQSESV